MNRRKFLRFAGGALAIGSAPAAVRALAATAKAPDRGLGGITPNADFYVTSYGRTPRVNPDGWRLKIHGLVLCLANIWSEREGLSLAKRCVP